MRKQTPIFTGILLFTCAVAAYFALRFGCATYNYLSLSCQTPAKILRWELEEVGSRCAAEALYEYKIQEKVFTAKARLSNLFFNEHVALDEIKATPVWTVFYNPSSPEHSSLERHFPKSFAIRFGLCCCVIVYFLTFIRRKLDLL